VCGTTKGEEGRNIFVDFLIGGTKKVVLKKGNQKLKNM